MSNKPTARELGEGVKFERIRRITGYLVGSMDRWSTGKRCEERDRVKHSVYEEASVITKTA